MSCLRVARRKRLRTSQRMLEVITTIGLDLGKNTFHVVGLDKRGAIVLRQKVSRAQLERRLANIPPCLIGMEACSGSHHIGRKLSEQGHEVRLIPAQYVKPFLKGHKNDYRDARTERTGITGQKSVRPFSPFGWRHQIGRRRLPQKRLDKAIGDASARSHALSDVATCPSSEFLRQ